MKILQISSVPVTYPGGTEKVVLELSKNLSKKHEVTILQTDLYLGGKIKLGKSKIGKVNVITCKNDSFLGGFGYSKEFKKKLEGVWEDFDIVHIHGHGRFTSDFSLKFLKGKLPMIYTAHGFFHKKSLIKRIHDFFLGGLLKNATRVTALSELEKREYQRLGIELDKIKILPNWINFSKFEKSKLGGKKVLYVGRIHESKGLQYVLDAVKGLDCEIEIVGRDAGYQRDLEKKIGEEGLREKVKISNNISDKELLKKYSSSDLFVLFSEWEGFGVVVLEAMASGLPVVVSDRGALPILVRDKENGFVVPFRDVSKLRENIEKVLESKDLRKKISKNNLRKAKEYDEKKIVKGYEGLYKEIA